MPFRKKVAKSLHELEGAGENLLFCDETSDGHRVTSANLRLCNFLRIGMKEAEVINSNFTQCEFHNSYFRKATFRNVDFTGSIFYDCNFDKAKFQCCTLKYARFYNCLIDAKEIEQSLPIEPNLRLELGRNLRANFLNQGDKESADHYMDIVMSAQEELYWRIASRESSYYRDNYDVLTSIKSLLNLLLLKTSKIVWGYGYKIERLLATFVVVMLSFSIVSSLAHLSYADAEGIVRELSIGESIYFYSAAIVTSSISNISPASTSSKILFITANLTGAIFIAVLAAAVFQKISRK